LDAALGEAVGRQDPIERPLVSALAYGTLRWHVRLAGLLDRMLSRPLRARDADLQTLLLLGLYQLIYMRLPAYAAVSQTVAAAKALGKPWATGLVNGDRRPETRTAHPAWLVERLRAAWPDQAESILRANNAQPPMALRVAAHRLARESYIGMLRANGLSATPLHETAGGLELERAVDVSALPGFATGLVSVQDGAAQLAAEILAAQAGERILDACAAPGGKTCHILELQPELGELWALDRDPFRLRQVLENLARLGLQARVVQGDAGRVEAWWDGRPFDRILLDAPCSATGVIRRHPDIKLLRRPGDILALAQRQKELLATLWPLLKRGGRLVYATCSVLPEENEQQILGFLGAHRDARETPAVARWGRPCRAGRQILPGDEGMDGFYYACLEKQ
jgi:16S rRNA (cytosine967-C5)-methyltransferase